VIFQRDFLEELQVLLEITNGIATCFSIFGRPLRTKLVAFFSETTYSSKILVIFNSPSRSEFCLILKSVANRFVQKPAEQIEKHCIVIASF